MARLGYHTVSDDCVSSSWAETVEEAIERGRGIVADHDDVDEAWARDDAGEVVWRSRDDDPASWCISCGRDTEKPAPPGCLARAAHVKG